MNTVWKFLACNKHAVNECYPNFSVILNSSYSDDNAIICQVTTEKNV